MIQVKYTKLILNALFHTRGSAGVTADEEKAALEASGVEWGVTPEQYRNAYELDGCVSSGPLTEHLKKMKDSINASEWWYTVDISKTLEYENSAGNTFTRNFTGWTVFQRAEQEAKYPDRAYLALFTKMPDENGVGYEEPNTDGESTYMRVNLLSGILNGEPSLASASMDSETGVATIVNRDLIAFPEVYGVSWGNIMGFGVFTVSTVGSGTPVFWGRVNTARDADPELVPHFRIGDFKVTLK